MRIGPHHVQQTRVSIRRRRLAAALSLAPLASTVRAQGALPRNITIVAPQAVGGGTDMFARAVALRLPKFLDWFEAAIHDTPGDWLIDHHWTYADTSLFQLVAGLRYMFPQRMATLEPDYPAIVRLHDAVAALPGVRAYLKSDRRLPFNEDGIFRHYPELDAA